MHFKSTAVASLAVLAAAASASPMEMSNPPPQKPSGKFGLAIAAKRAIDLNEVHSTELVYANNSMYLGQIRYQQYAEPLVLTGAYQGDDVQGGLSFTSVHSTPTGFQDAFVELNHTAPVQFTGPHSAAKPDDAVTSPFYFSTQSDRVPATLNWNSENRFFACQTDELKALKSYQIWWQANDAFPAGVHCKGPINIVMTPA